MLIKKELSMIEFLQIEHRFTLPQAMIHFIFDERWKIMEVKEFLLKF